MTDVTPLHVDQRQRALRLNVTDQPRQLLHPIRAELFEERSLGFDDRDPFAHRFGHDVAKDTDAGGACRQAPLHEKFD